MYRNRTSTDALTVTDNRTQFFRRTRLLLDTLNVVDSFIRLATGTQTRVAVSDVRMSDLATVYRQVVRLLADSAVVSDQGLPVRLRTRVSGDALALADTYVGTLVGAGVVNSRTLTDPIALLDAVTMFRRITRVIGDLVTTLDSYLSATSGSRAVTASDSMRVTDEVIASRLRARIVTETLPVSDVRFRSVIRMRDVVESVAVSDGHAKFFLRTRELLDSLGVSDSVASSIVRFAGSIISVRIRVGMSYGSQVGFGAGIATVGITTSGIEIGVR
jgi:hypothetical protein